MKNKLKTFNKALLGGLALSTLAMGYAGAEKNHQHYTGQTQANKKAVDIEAMAKTLDQKIDTILQNLAINPYSKSITEQKANAFKLFQYVIDNATYDLNIMQEKREEPGTTMREHEIQDAYRCLIEGRSVCTSDAIALSLMFRKMGLRSIHLTIAQIEKNEKGETFESNYHEVVYVSFGKTQFYCDPTTMRAALEKQIIPYLNPSVFLFTTEVFFGKLHENFRIKQLHRPITLQSETNKDKVQKIDRLDHPVEEFKMQRPRFIADYEM